jgi:23S rRNA (pseudouridine1915-N3)-methyltransferase
MKITIISVGKIKEVYFKEAVAEYTGRIKHYANFNKIEIADEKIIESIPANIIKDREAEKILKAIPLTSYKIAMTEAGKRFDSNKFSGFINEIKEKNTEITFIIGGALGLSDLVLKEVDYKLSLSDMTLPHQMAYLFLAEQVYRAFKIINNEPYHK